MENTYKIKSKRRKQKINLFLNIIFCLITLASLTGCIILLLLNYSLKSKNAITVVNLETIRQETEDRIYTQEDLDAGIEEAKSDARIEGSEEIRSFVKESLLNGVSTSGIFRELFPEDVVVYADGAYQFFPIEESLKKNTYKPEHFQLQESGEVAYLNDNEETVSYKGIDVSKYQGKINWQKVAEDGVYYAYIRAGLRGSTEGKLSVDETFRDNIENALKNHIHAGVYFFTQAITEEEAREEAEFVLDLIKDYEITYPVVIDVEEVTAKNARTAGLTQEEYTKNCIAFCEVIREAGYTPMIYGNLKTFFIMLDLKELEDYEKWFAYYNAPVYFPYEYSTWQYSSTGSISGIKGNVDLNVSMKDYSRQ